MEKFLRVLFPCFAVIVLLCVWAGRGSGISGEAFDGNVAEVSANNPDANAPPNSQDGASHSLEKHHPLPGKPKVRAEIVAIGDELCYGKVYDTNSFWIADQVTARGVLVQRIVCVRDDLADMRSVLEDSLSRGPRFIFITGGLGHTSDDKTREALSAVTGRRIVRRPDILEFIARQRKVPVEKLPPHFAISTSSLEGARCLPNPAGVSPVTVIDHAKTQIIALPGPPREVYACFAAHLADMVENVTGYHSFSRRAFIKMHESELTPLMTKVMGEIPGTYVKALVGDYSSEGGMPIEVMAFGPSQAICREICGKAVEKLRQLAAEKGRQTIEVPEGKE